MKVAEGAGQTLDEFGYRCGDAARTLEWSGDCGKGPMVSGGHGGSALREAVEEGIGGDWRGLEGIGGDWRGLEGIGTASTHGAEELSGEIPCGRIV